MKMRNKVLIIIAVIVGVVGIFIAVAPWIYLEPLHFSVENCDNRIHNVTVEIFNSKGKCIFNESYTLDPEEETESDSITKQEGEYTLRVTLDHNLTKEYKAMVGTGYTTVTISLYWDFYQGDPRCYPIYIGQAVY